MRCVLAGCALFGAAVLADEDAAAERAQRPLAELRAEIARRFQDERPEPEPPAGLLAPEGSKRRQRASERYAKALAKWRADQRDRDRELVRLCNRYLGRDAGRKEIRRIRGTVRFRLGLFREARADLRAALPAARDLLVECCRLLGDYSAALRHAGPQPPPELLEEAGQIDSAILAARRAGLAARATQWARIGKKCPAPVRRPEGRFELLIAAGGGAALPPEIKDALRLRFGKKIGFGVVITGEPVIYLLDGNGKVLAVNPRPPSWTHRLERILGSR